MPMAAAASPSKPIVVHRKEVARGMLPLSRVCAEMWAASIFTSVATGVTVLLLEMGPELLVRAGVVRAESEPASRPLAMTYSRAVDCAVAGVDALPALSVGLAMVAVAEVVDVVEVAGTLVDVVDAVDVVVGTVGEGGG